MCSNASITEILGINDKNLVILGNEKENIKGIEYTVLRGKLSYRPACCPKCGIVNENYDIIRNGSQTVKILFNRVNTNPLILMVKKQRFFCKHCESTFMAKTPIVDKGCFISNDVKRSIVLNLCETFKFKRESNQTSHSPALLTFRPNKSNHFLIYFHYSLIFFHIFKRHPFTAIFTNCKSIVRYIFRQEIR